MDRALLPGVAAGLSVGALLGTAGMSVWWTVPLGVLSLAAALWRRSAVFVWAAALLGGMALPQPGGPPVYWEQQLPLLQEARVRVTGIPDPRARSTEVLAELEGHRADIRLLVYLPPGNPVEPGDTLHVRGRGAWPHPDEWADHLRRRGVYGLFLAQEAQVLAEGESGPLRWANQVRTTLLRRFTHSMTEQGAALFAALLLGARSQLPAGRQEAFRRAGVAHMLALSGLHLGMLVTGGWLALRLLRIPSPVAYTLLLAFVGFYVLVGGARVSLIRAALVFCCVGTFWILWHRGWVLRRWLDPLQGVATAAVLVVLIWPWSPADAAFQLSFLATGSIVLLLPEWRESRLRARLPGPVMRPADLLAVTACAQAGALPVIGATFGHIAPLGLLVNLILVPWTALVLAAGVGVLVGPALGPVADTLLVGPYLAFVDRLAAIPGAEVAVGPGFGLWWAAATLAVVLGRAVLRERERLWA